MNKEKIVPKIRFKEFSNNWVKCKLGEVSDISSGGTPSRGESSYWNGDIPWATTAEVKYSEITDTKEKITIDGLNNSSAKLMPVGTILLAMYGQGKTRGQLGILSIEAATNQANANIQVHRYIYNYFVYYQLVKKYNLLRNLANEGGQANLSLGIVKSVNIVVTNNLDEQLKIGEFFKQLDNIITLQQQLLNDHKQLKKAMLQKMFPQKGESVPRIRFAGFTDVWKEEELGSLVEIKTGKLDANAMKVNGAYDFYTSGIKKYKIDIPAFKGPAITIAGNGATVGYMHYADGDFNAYQRTYVLTNFLSDRLFLFQSIKLELPKKIYQEARMGNIPYIVMSMLTGLRLFIPTTEEQTKIGKIFKQLDETIEIHEKKLETYQELKKAMLQKMFV